MAVPELTVIQETTSDEISSATAIEERVLDLKDAYPVFSDVEFKFSDSVEDPKLLNSPGYCKWPRSEDEKVTVVVNKNKEAVRQVFLERITALEHTASLLGREPGDLIDDADTLQAFVLLHEAGHAYDFIVNFVSKYSSLAEAVDAWKKTGWDALMSLPVKGKSAGQVNKMLLSGSLDTYMAEFPLVFRGYNSAQDLAQTHEQEYRDLPKEKYADAFAAYELTTRTKSDTHEELLDSPAEEAYIFPDQEFRDFSLEVQEMLKTRQAIVEKYTCYNLNTGEEEVTDVIVFYHTQQFPQRLPKGYGFIGGTARTILLRELGEYADLPRDYDIAGISDHGADYALARELSADYMAEDYEIDPSNGAKITSMEHYMDSRDFTINEIFADNEKIYLTRRCLEDTVGHVIRITDHELRYPDIRYKIIAKALRLESELKLDYPEAHIVEEQQNSVRYALLPPFFLALHLNKALQRGVEHAVSFYNTLVNYQIIDKKTTDPWETDPIQKEDYQADDVLEFYTLLKTKLSLRNSDFEFSSNTRQTIEDLEAILKRPSRLHRNTAKAAANIHRIKHTSPTLRRYLQSDYSEI
jgi:hypothetical protein